MSHAWAEQLMTDHQTTEQVFDAVDLALAAPEGPAPGLLQDALMYFEGYVDGYGELGAWRLDEAVGAGDEAWALVRGEGR